LTGEDKPYEQIYSAVNEYLEEIPESVVFLEISGDPGAVLSLQRSLGNTCLIKELSCQGLTTLQDKRVPPAKRF